MRLKKHIPEFISGMVQFKELDKTETIELDKIDAKLHDIQNNQFVMTANHEGLSRYEQMFNITPVSDIDIRRFNILIKFNSSIPFTMRWLINMLNTTVGIGNYLVYLEHEKYNLNVSIIEDKEYIVKSLFTMLRKRIPANLTLNISILTSIESHLYTGVVIRTYDKNNI